MKRAVSISIGSSKRDKRAEITLLGETVLLERIGTDGDMEKAARLFQELDGKVDAFGVGGTDLALRVGKKTYPLHSVQSLVRFVRHTPVVDGGGLKNTLEHRLAAFLESRIGDYIRASGGKKALITSSADRWGMAASFAEAGYETVFGDLMFGLGLPLPLHTLRSVEIMAALLLPVVGRLPFEWLYPTGEKQDEWVPKWEKYYRWATVIAGDCHYVKRHLPRQLEGKVIVTNTTVPADVARFQEAGIKYLVTSTPLLDGRTFGTNMMEAALVAVAGKGRPLSEDELNAYLDQLGLEPQIQALN